MKKIQIFTNGLVKENPVLRLVLGTCPTLAVTTAVSNGIGMGIAATFVLFCSNIAISALRKVIPDKVRLPAYITVIATFVTIVQMLVKAFVPALDESLGVFLPLIVVNCIILGRAEMFASKHGVVDSAFDGLGMGLGFTLTRAAGQRHLVRLQGHPREHRPLHLHDHPRRRLLHLRPADGSGGLRGEQAGREQKAQHRLRGLPLQGRLRRERRL